MRGFDVPELKIPRSARLGLAVLRKMEDEALAPLLLEIGRSPGSTPVTQGITSRDAGHLMDAIRSMAQVQEYNEVPLAEFVSDVCEALREANELQLTEEPRFRERLATVLNVEGLKTAVKASVLSLEYERRYCTSRILTDARPVYGPNVSESPVAIMISHTLKIAYHAAGADVNEIYFALGSSDLEELRSVLNRAEEKAKSLKAAFPPSIKLVDPQHG
jgi:hypothetical protein